MHRFDQWRVDARRRDEEVPVAAVDVERRGPVVWIRIDRPDRRNAYDLGMARTMTAAVEDAAEADAVVLTGSGGSFCAGGALDRLGDADPAELRALFTASLRLVNAIRSCPRPVIAAVDGAAAGGGNELVVACDFAIATRRSTFGQTGPKVGSAGVLGATNLLAVQIGEKRAKEMAMLCRRYTAEQALALGLVNEVVEDGALDEAVGRWLADIHRLSPRYLEIAKISSNQWWHQSGDNMSSGLGMLLQAIGSEDMREGARAFLEKRAPRFRGGRGASAPREGAEQ
ncbi:enoyl-CoA hydratase/isomerase family protein [Actinomadura madurae]|uniref:enoyl-CoA hydratase/isomerase family protein n=1 Tax=Actinomadura madurae TaxID=1993 RepID=UPI002026B96D|nr:enoyl-CoA hydratase/isomerase family protein [Actinomadura madurae]URM93865.1 enoyl-CoA hydratase/isomerase family protein [Actinomadura madurae]URN04589.1 enoyl-CoA hydratase/isomerase family protein [Actinomadura madurae]